MKYDTLHVLGAYYGTNCLLSVMDDFGNLVSLGHKEGAPLQQWHYSLAN